MIRRRGINVFGLSFLDVMFCGFGSVILLVMIINADALAQRKVEQQGLRGDLTRAERELTERKAHLTELQRELDDVVQALAATRQRASQASDRIEAMESRQARASADAETRARRIAALQRELKTSDAEARQLAAERRAAQADGVKVRQFLGDGDRQYLTGLHLGGARIVILVDASASMLDETIVNVIRRRNLPDAKQRTTPKWQRALRTVEWLVSQLPPSSQFQLLLFNTRVRAATGDTQWHWLRASDRMAVNNAIAGLLQVAPAGGTNLYTAFTALRRLTPNPDNVILLTDSLPTQGKTAPAGNRATGKQRLRFFNEAVDILPANIPVNTILLPFEGDPFAASAFWKLAMSTQGSFMTPSRDWP